jgi:peptidoglycan/xylan/chitin deacetylase (PgdA/CDA1 family)
MTRVHAARVAWAAFVCALLAGAVVGGASPASAFSNMGGDSLPANEGPHAGIAPDGRVWYVPMQRKEIALTFDDGPYPFYTPLLLHQLAMEERTPATFFLVGRTVQEYPQLVERILSAGGEIGNHTFNHYSLTGLSDEEIEDQIADCGALLSQYTGSQPTLFRPPHGRYDARVVEIARRLGYRTILWSDAPDDAPKDNTDVPVAVIVERVLAHAKPGGIVLLHSGQYNTIEAIPQIVDTLRAEGYTFVTVSQLLADQT